MDLSKLLSGDDAPAASNRAHNDRYHQNRSYATRQASLTSSEQPVTTIEATHMQNMPYTAQSDQALTTLSHGSENPKVVGFPLILSEGAQQQARLPLRVNVSPNDTTDSIVSTVKNFYGLYEGQGVSFEDKNGNAIVPRYQNLSASDVVNVHITQPKAVKEDRQHLLIDLPLPRPQLGAPFQMLPPYPPTRPVSGPIRKTSDSAIHRNRLTGSMQSQMLADDTANGYSDSDNGSVSVTSSRRAKSDILATAEISTDNIVEGGRRKRAKFESSELPLFMPPQMPMPTSASSISPQRRMAYPNAASPLLYGINQASFQQHMPSPQGYGPIDQSSNRPSNNVYDASMSYNRSVTLGYARPRLYGGSNPAILPTPDPTNSVISDEDAAYQLMRLGDISNVSHGRTSTSTLDDAQSGKAEVMSSAEDSEIDVSHRKSANAAGPPSKKQKGLASSVNHRYTETSDGEGHTRNGPTSKTENGSSAKHHLKNIKIPKSRHVTGSKIPKQPASASGSSKAKTPSASYLPMSPYSIPASGRKGSNASLMTLHTQGDNEEGDLSSKPRCQRCRKSKKGCDRQRPCQRCTDAGIGVDGCVSEEEGNGRKGRYGRHMGVPVKLSLSGEGTPQPQSPASAGFGLPAIETLDSANKKRKR